MFSLGYILLRGKDFTIPDEVATGIVGVFFGVVIALFYYQGYRRTYYWWYSIGSGFLLATMSKSILQAIPGIDTGSLWFVLATFVLPFLGVLAVNHYLYILKQRHSKRRKRRKQHSSFFDTAESTHAVQEVTSQRKN